ncbi:uncharacterized protein N7477_009709 [Penicillium maclennaniae]|uniref:uncharacterized protein n=1 Tax=Penicillium maclennaniae TaxID=1343394 RepID=UPI0025416FDB|nr:uncharacterized protein N7477_009709 [Penicillium maclennaniae]KAJ5662093.1 hypothetical protein N7477_009709 [Penicillium maclennaniae]
MNPPDTSGRLSNTPCGKYRTSRRHSPPGTSTSSKSSTFKRPASPSVSAPARPWKRSSVPSSRAQSTLTQIDFVTQSAHSDDDQLEYLDETQPREGTSATNPQDRMDGDSEESNGDGASLRPTKFEPTKNHLSRRRKSVGVTPRASERSQSIRKNLTPKMSFSEKRRQKSTEKPPAKRDKTLTQMDFVRRYITIDDDDDVNMGYIQPEQKGMPPDYAQQAPSIENQPIHPKSSASAKRNRRHLEPELDLSTGEPLSGGLGDNQDSNPGHDVENAPKDNAPVTPQKPRRLEIPSSQSPESPGLAIITSSQFRSATRSPLRQKTWNLACHSERIIKEEYSDPQRILEDSQDHGGESLAKTSPQPSPKLLDSLKHHSSPVMQNRAFYAPSTELDSQAGLPGGLEIKVERAHKERTVVYETDADTDDSESENNMNNDRATPSPAHGPHVKTPTSARHSPEPSSDDSEEIPLPDVNPSTDPNDGPPSEAPMFEAPLSDASIFYQRMQPATQFPFEPIPTLNTQKLSELFPNFGSTQHAKPSAAGSSQKSQTQSQEADQTELVPESSPVHEQDENDVDSGAIFQRPQGPESVVQVESSQPVDRGNHRLAGVLSRSQLLTSSVMESVPLPHFWMGSQDSVGEPYNLPDR